MVTSAQRNLLSIHETTEQFKTAMFDAGIQAPDNIIADGSLHRFKIDGKLNGAYVLHLDGTPAGYFQDFKQGIKQNWKAHTSKRQFSDAERQAFKVLIAKAAHDKRLAEANRHTQASIKARFIWRNAEPASHTHPYLLTKQIEPHGCRMDKQALVVPIYSAVDQLVNVQFIYEDGTKRFLTGGRKKSCFNWLGRSQLPSQILICEGFATGASLHQETGLPIVVAFDAGNLSPVAIEVRKRCANSEIIICGDNDLSGVGQKAAEAAAMACHGKYIIPDRPDYDWNDLAVAGRAL